VAQGESTITKQEFDSEAHMDLTIYNSLLRDGGQFCRAPRVTPTPLPRIYVATPWLPLRSWIRIHRSAGATGISNVDELSAGLVTLRRYKPLRFSDCCLVKV
jgi:hypothetical protein